MRARRLFLIVLTSCFLTAGPGQAEQTTASAACDNSQLKNAIQASPKDDLRRVMELERLLACLGSRADPLTAAAAAYELTLHFAGADGGKNDFRRAAAWAHKSADLLRPWQDPDLRSKTELAALRLDYYAAEAAAALEKVARNLGRFIALHCRRGASSPQCAESLMLLGDVERDRAGKGNAQARRHAISLYGKFLQTPAGREPGPDRASVLLDRGTLILETNARDPRPPEIEDAETALREADTYFEKEHDAYRTMLARVNLGALLTEHRAAHAAALDEAEMLLRPLTNSSNDAVRLAALRNLGSVLAQKQTGNHQANLDEAIEALRIAYASVPKDDLSSRVKTGVSLALVLESSGLQEARNLAEAQTVLEDLLNLTKRARTDVFVSAILSTLVKVRLHRKSIGEDEDMTAIGVILARARASVGENRLEQGRLAALAADYYRARTISGESRAMDAGIRELRRALHLIDHSRAPEIWATLQNNLGNLCNNRRRPDLARCAADAYAMALTVRTAEAMPREHLDTLVNLANLRFNQRDWPAASSLYQKVAAVSRASFDPTLDHRIVLFDAARSDRWYERAAYAMAKIGKTTEAIAIADEGRLRVLKQRLRNVSLISEGDFVIDRLKGLLRDRTVVVMPVVTTAGTVIFAISRESGRVEAQQLFLERLDGDTAARFLDNQWLHKYADAFEIEQSKKGATESWSANVAEAGRWIGAQLFAPTLKWLQTRGKWPVDNLILVVQGELALLPLHLAELSTGQRLLDVTNVSYLPSLGLWQPSAPFGPERRVFSVSNPSQGADLPFAAIEAVASTIISGVNVAPPVDKARMLQILGQADILHFVGHASFDVDDPEASGLRLSNDERLQVRDIQAAKPARTPLLVILSACETGRVETATMANEFIGLPSAFMSIGVKGVVSSLWPASDGPSFFLMTRLIAELRDGRKSVAAALRDAQLWLAHSKGRELASVLHSVHPARDTDAARLEQALKTTLRDSQPYANPWAWAGFFYSGVVQ